MILQFGGVEHSALCYSRCICLSPILTLMLAGCVLRYRQHPPSAPLHKTAQQFQALILNPSFKFIFPLFIWTINSAIFSHFEFSRSIVYIENLRTHWNQCRRMNLCSYIIEKLLSVCWLLRRRRTSTETRIKAEREREKKHDHHCLFFLRACEIEKAKKTIQIRKKEE